MNSSFCFLAKQKHVHFNVFSALLMLLPHSRYHSWYYYDGTIQTWIVGKRSPTSTLLPLPRYRFIMSAVAHNINNKPASNQRKQKLGGLFRNVFIHVWLRLGFFVSNRMSVEFSRKSGLLKRRNNLFWKNFPRHAQTTLAIMGGRSEWRVPRTIHSVEFHVFCAIQVIS